MKCMPDGTDSFDAYLSNPEVEKYMKVAYPDWFDPAHRYSAHMKNYMCDGYIASAHSSSLYAPVREGPEAGWPTPAPIIHEMNYWGVCAAPVHGTIYSIPRVDAPVTTRKGKGKGKGRGKGRGMAFGSPLEEVDKAVVENEVHTLLGGPYHPWVHRVERFNCPNPARLSSSDRTPLSVLWHESMCGDNAPVLDFAYKHVYLNHDSNGPIPGADLGACVPFRLPDDLDAYYREHSIHGFDERVCECNTKCDMATTEACIKSLSYGLH